MSHIKNFVFTYNNPTITPDQLWANLQSKAKYLIFQLEKGENGTPHFQGYCELSRQSRFLSITRLLPGVHIEHRRGTQAQAKEYASKADTRVEGPFEYGEFTPSNPGQRTDVRAFRDAILSGKRKRELLEEYPADLQRYPKFVELCRSTIVQQPRITLRVHLLWGEPGLGKSRFAYESSDDLYAVPIGKDLWFDGYDGQTTLLLDDFSGEMKLVHLLRLLDIYPMQVPVKGAFVNLTATTIFITSNKHPRDWYDWEKHGNVRYRALMRRFHKITRFSLDHNSCPVSEDEELEDHPVAVASFAVGVEPELLNVNSEDPSGKTHSISK